MATKPSVKQTSKSKTTPVKAVPRKAAKTPSNSGKEKKTNKAGDTRPQREDGRKFHSATPISARAAAKAGMVGRAAIQLKHETTKTSRRQVTLDTLLEARDAGDLPHVFLLKVMRGEAMIHQAFDSDSGEIVDMVVLPTYQDRLDAAHKAAPYFSQKLPVAKDPNPGRIGSSGVMETPMVDNLEQWTKIAAMSQAQLKEDVTK